MLYDIKLKKKHIRPTQLLLPATLNVAMSRSKIFRTANRGAVSQWKIVEQLLKRKRIGYEANNFSLGNGPPIRGSIDLWTWHWPYSVTQLPVEFQWHWRLSNAEISIIRTIEIHILVNLMIKMINLIDIWLWWLIFHYLTPVNATGIPPAIE